ncbi:MULTISPECIES: hypothetical protein [unclassified Myroides]|uniref:hypothetical protein n=1 Tax=unclassified Myroides TaxID=2642485 RepID=UPI0031018BC6
MKTSGEVKNIEKYKEEVKNKTDRELLEEKAYFTFATYRTIEKVHTLLYIITLMSVLVLLYFVFEYLILNRLT